MSSLVHNNVFNVDVLKAPVRYLFLRLLILGETLTLFRVIRFFFSSDVKGHFLQYSKQIFEHIIVIFSLIHSTSPNNII